ncbi:MAG: transposase [Chloroflexi bacterium]|nr:transposase [Chloroflexota bacterium]
MPLTQTDHRPVNEKLIIGVVHLIIEPTGGYEVALVSEAYRRQWRVTLVNPLTVRRWHQGRGKRGKADRLDTQMLTLFGADQNPPAQPPTDEAAAHLDSLLRRQDDLQQLLRSERNRREQTGLNPNTPKAVSESIQRTLDALEQELAAIEQALRQLFTDHVALTHQLKQLISVPGIGQKSAPYLLAFCHRFYPKTNGTGTAKQIVAFAGLDPQPFESGLSVHRRPTISKQGAAAIRSKLFMCALGGVRGRNRLKDIYTALCARGKAKKLALVACARKALVWAWSVFIHDTTFDPAHFLKA